METCFSDGREWVWHKLPESQRTGAGVGILNLLAFILMHGFPSTCIFLIFYFPSLSVNPCALSTVVSKYEVEIYVPDSLESRQCDCVYANVWACKMWRFRFCINSVVVLSTRIIFPKLFSSVHITIHEVPFIFWLENISCQLQMLRNSSKLSRLRPVFHC